MEKTPYTPPRAPLSDEDSSRSRRGGWLARLGVILFTGPVWGMLATGFAMVRAFNTLAEDEPAAADALAHDISFALMATMAGIGLGLVGLVLILTALLGMKNREKWFFNWSVVLAVIWCLMIFPYGLVVGVPVLVLFLSRRAEFVTPSLLPNVGGR